MQFTYDAYISLIVKLRCFGYHFVGYDTCDNYERCVILRHDIDYSIDKALILAELEAKQGVKSTYFTLLSSQFYNLISRENKEKLQYINSLGHDIGLHFDELNYEGRQVKEQCKSLIINEVELMENILQLNIKCVSMHRPSRETLEANYNLDPIINSYGQKFFNDFKYISDSRHKWRENVDKIIEDGNFNKLHILTHAFWYNNENEELEESIKKFVNSANIERYYTLSKNISDLCSIMEEGEVIR